MNARTAVILLLVVCAVLAGLLLGGTLAPVAAGVVFAMSLVVLGVASGGFKKRPAGR